MTKPINWQEIQTSCQIFPIGTVHSCFTRREECPKQDSESRAGAWLNIDPNFIDGLDGIEIGTKLILVTWLHEAQRSTLTVHPRANPCSSLRGVFISRSPDRPNPIGLHRVEVLKMKESNRIYVHPLEVVDGTLIVDIKSVRHRLIDY